MNLFCGFTQGHHNMNSCKWYYFPFNILFICQLELHPKKFRCFQGKYQIKMFWCPTTLQTHTTLKKFYQIKDVNIFSYSSCQKLSNAMLIFSIGFYFPFQMDKTLKT